MHNREYFYRRDLEKIYTLFSSCIKTYLIEI